MINRRNFLALIPSLSAIPLIGKEIIQEQDKVTIIKPEPIAIQEHPPITDFRLSDCEVKIFHKGQEIGSGYITELSIDTPTMFDTSVRDSDGFSRMYPGLRTTEIKATLNSLML